MAKVYELCGNNEIMELLGKDTNEVNSSIFRSGDGNQTVINANEKTLIIGVGGSGVLTVNHLKKELLNRCTRDSVLSHVSFLAIDTDNTEGRGLGALRYLNSNEKQYLKPVTPEKSWRNPDPGTNDIRPTYVKRFLPDDLGDVRITSSTGAGQNRIAGKARLFDFSIENGSDIYDKLEGIINSRIESLQYNPGEKLNIIFVMSVAGGTGSGGLITIPAIVMNAIKQLPNMPQTDAYNRYGFFYMPDTSIGDTLNPPESMLFNGYAALKELEYYISSIQLLDGSTRLIKLKNDNVEIRNTSLLYTAPYLVSTTGKGSDNRARQTIAESIVDMLSSNTQISDEDGQISLLGYMANIPTYRNNALNRPNVFGEDSYMYSSIGYGYAGVRENAFKGYIYKGIIERLSPQDKEDFSQTHFATIPFNKETADTAISRTLALLSVNDVKGYIKDAVGSNLESWKDHGKLKLVDIKETKPDDVATDLINDVEALNMIDIRIRQSYQNFEQNVFSMLANEGPYVLLAMYEGRALNTEGEEISYDGGIKQRLNEFRNEHGESKETDARKAANSVHRNVEAKLIAPLKIDLWHARVRELAFAKLQEKLNRAVFNTSEGENITAGKLKAFYIDRITDLFEKIESFKAVLESMKSIYADKGNKMNSFDEYNESSEDDREVNIISTEKEYDALLNQAKNIINNANYSVIKSNIVQCFSNNMDTWHNTEKAKDNFALREMFDGQLSNVNIDNAIFKLKHYFDNSFQKGTLTTFVENIVRSVYGKAIPLMNRKDDVPVGGYRIVIVVPGDILKSAPNGDAYRAAFKSACAAISSGIIVIEGEQKDRIICYRLDSAFPLYSFNMLPKMRAEYDKAVKNRKIGLHTNEASYGEFSEKDGLKWVNRASIEQCVDPIMEVIDGKATNESLQRKQLNNDINRWIDCELLCPVEEKDGGVVSYYFEANILANLRNLDSDGGIGYVFNPEFRIEKYSALYEDIANKTLDENGSPQSVQKVKVLLTTSKDAAGRGESIEAAKKSMARVLRKNTGLYIDIRNTYRMVEKAVKDFEQLKRKQELMRLVVDLIACGELKNREGTSTIWVMSSEEEKTLLNISRTNISAKYGDNSLQYQLAISDKSRCSKYLLADALCDLEEEKIEWLKSIYDNWFQQYQERENSNATEQLNEMKKNVCERLTDVISDLDVFHSEYIDRGNPQILTNKGELFKACNMRLTNDEDVAAFMKFSENITDFREVLGNKLKAYQE